MKTPFLDSLKTDELTSLRDLLKRQNERRDSILTNEISKLKIVIGEDGFNAILTRMTPEEQYVLVQNTWELLQWSQALEKKINAQSTEDSQHGQ